MLPRVQQLPPRTTTNITGTVVSRNHEAAASAPKRLPTSTLNATSKTEPVAGTSRINKSYLDQNEECVAISLVATTTSTTSPPLIRRPRLLQFAEHGQTQQHTCLKVPEIDLTCQSPPLATYIACAPQEGVTALNGKCLDNENFQPSVKLPPTTTTNIIGTVVSQNDDLAAGVSRRPPSATLNAAGKTKPVAGTSRIGKNYHDQIKECVANSLKAAATSINSPPVTRLLQSAERGQTQQHACPKVSEIDLTGQFPPSATSLACTPQERVPPLNEEGLDNENPQLSEKDSGKVDKSNDLKVHRVSNQTEYVDRVNPNELQGLKEVTFRSASCLEESTSKKRADKPEAADFPTQNVETLKKTLLLVRKWGECLIEVGFLDGSRTSYSALFLKQESSEEKLLLLAPGRERLYLPKTSECPETIKVSYNEISSGSLAFNTNGCQMLRFQHPYEPCTMITTLYLDDNYSLRQVIGNRQNEKVGFLLPVQRFIQHIHVTERTNGRSSSISVEPFSWLEQFVHGVQVQRNQYQKYAFQTHLQKEYLVIVFTKYILFLCAREVQGLESFLRAEMVFGDMRTSVFDWKDQLRFQFPDGRVIWTDCRPARNFRDVILREQSFALQRGDVFAKAEIPPPMSCQPCLCNNMIRYIEAFTMFEVTGKTKDLNLILHLNQFGSNESHEILFQRNSNTEVVLRCLDIVVIPMIGLNSALAGRLSKALTEPSKNNDPTKVMLQFKSSNEATLKIGSTTFSTSFYSNYKNEERPKVSDEVKLDQILILSKEYLSAALPHDSKVLTQYTYVWNRDRSGNFKSPRTPGYFSTSDFIDDVKVAFDSNAKKNIQQLQLTWATWLKTCRELLGRAKVALKQPPPTAKDSHQTPRFSMPMQMTQILEGEQSNALPPLVSKKQPSLPVTRVLETYGEPRKTLQPAGKPTNAVLSRRRESARREGIFQTASVDPKQVAFRPKPKTAAELKKQVSIPRVSSFRGKDTKLLKSHAEAREASKEGEGPAAAATLAVVVNPGAILSLASKSEPASPPKQKGPMEATNMGEIVMVPSDQISDSEEEDDSQPAELGHQETEPSKEETNTLLTIFPITSDDDSGIEEARSPLPRLNLDHCPVIIPRKKPRLDNDKVCNLCPGLGVFATKRLLEEHQVIHRGQDMTKENVWPRRKRKHMKDILAMLSTPVPPPAKKSKIPQIAEVFVCFECVPPKMLEDPEEHSRKRIHFKFSRFETFQKAEAAAAFRSTAVYVCFDCGPARITVQPEEHMNNFKHFQVEMFNSYDDAQEAMLNKL